MNERIRKLIAEADRKCSETHGIYDEILAELIVAECINVLDPNGEYTEKYKHSHIPETDGLRQVLSQEHYFEMLASNKLKNHFGVEE